MSLIAALLLGSVSAALQPPLVLENAWMRVEFQPELGAVRYLGAQDGANLVEALPVRSSTLRNGGPIDPGGITWRVVREDGSESADGRSRAEVLLREPRRVVFRLLPVLERPHRLQVSLTLAAKRPELTVRTVLVSFEAQEQPSALQSIWRLPPEASTTFSSEDGTFERMALYGGYGDAEDSRPASAFSGVTAGVAITRGGYTLRRAWSDKPPYRHGFNLMAVHDEWTHTHGLLVESGWRAVSVGTPLVHVERWTLEPTQE